VLAVHILLTNLNISKKGGGKKVRRKSGKKSLSVHLHTIRGEKRNPPTKKIRENTGKEEKGKKKEKSYSSSNNRSQKKRGDYGANGEDS